MLEGCGVTGGFMCELIKHILFCLNEYAVRNVVGGHFAGSFWHPIETEEMFHALGIMFKMSIDN